MGKETLKNVIGDLFGGLGKLFGKCAVLLKNKWVIWTLVILVVFFGGKFLLTKYGEMKMILGAVKPKQVEVITVQEQDVLKSFEFSGRVEAKYSVDIIARVQGFLQKSYFKEGDFVKKGQVLFQIEPYEYQNTVKNAQAALNSTRASLTNAEKNLVRAKELVKHDFVSKSFYDDAIAQRDMYKGNLDMNKAQLAQAKLNLSYTKITAPVDGKMGKILITQGNLVNLTKGTIAKLISTSPIYVTFTLKSEDYLKFKKADSSQDVSNTTVTLKLSDGTPYNEVGKVEFIDNEVDLSSGTITMRATFQNKENLLVPSDFITVYLNPINPRHEILVPMEAVQDSTDGLFVYVVKQTDDVTAKMPAFIKAMAKMMKVDLNTNYIAQKRIIKTTEQYKDFWIVDSGLKPGEKIVLQGLTKIKDNSPVKIVDKIKEENEE